MQEMRKYFDSELLPNSNKIVYQNNTISELKHIKISALKGLLCSKFIKAQSLNVDLSCDFGKDLTKINIGVFDLCRIIGIIFDNAIEATVGSENPQIIFSVVEKKQQILIGLKNTYVGEIPPVYKMLESGFSTKVNHDGIGLTTVRNILEEKYPNIYFDIVLEDNMVMHKLYI
jgi:two-component system sensor histidine kinase AgrC